MPRKITAFGLKFREMFPDYKGKLSKNEMGKELWNVYCKMKNNERHHSAEHIAEIEARKKARKEARERKMNDPLYKLTKRIDTYRIYCSDIENVENFHNAKEACFRGWQLHHRLETHTENGEKRENNILATTLIKNNMYFHRPASELIFMKTKEHRRLHNVKNNTKI